MRTCFPVIGPGESALLHDLVAHVPVEIGVVGGGGADGGEVDRRLSGAGRAVVVRVVGIVVGSNPCAGGIWEWENKECCSLTYAQG